MRQITDLIFSSAPEELAKSGGYVRAGEGGSGNAGWVPKSWFTDPFALLDTLGLGYKTSPSGLSYETLKQMSEHNVVVAAIIQTRVHQVASFCRPQQNKYSVGYKVTYKDEFKKLSEGETTFIRELESFIAQCGVDDNPDRDDIEGYVKKIVRDRMIYDQMCTEIVSKFSGKPHAFYAIPGSTIRLASPKKRKGTPMTMKEAQSREAIKYIQIIDGSIVNTYTPNEVLFSVANPRTDIRAWGYGYSELEMLIKTVTSHLWAEEWNRRVFSQGSTTKGLLNIKGNIPPQQLDAFKRQWLTQISGVANAWRTPIINSNDEIQWINLQPTNQEMGFQEWMHYLIKLACAVYLIDPSEINFDLRSGPGQAPMFMTTNEAQQKVSQDRGLRPLLRHVEKHIQKIIDKIDPDYKFKFVGVDARTEAEAISLRLQELQSYKSINEVREAEQLPPVPHGDIIPNPSYIGYLGQKEMQQQQSQMQMQMGGGVPGQQQPSPESLQAGQAVKREIGEKKKESRWSTEKRVPDRLYRPDEEWEHTYTASFRDDDLQKALEPLNDLLDD